MPIFSAAVPVATRLSRGCAVSITEHLTTLATPADFLQSV